MAELSEQDKQEITEFFAENKRLKGVCFRVEESFRAVVAEIWTQANKIDQLQAENEELKRENERLKTGTVDMTKPQPCTKFAGVTVEERVAKLNEETYGVMRDAAHIELIADEADDEDKSSLATCLAIDLTDVIHVCVSWIAALGFNEEARGDLNRMVNEKNRERGYF